MAPYWAVFIWIRILVEVKWTQYTALCEVSSIPILKTEVYSSELVLHVHNIIYNLYNYYAQSREIALYLKLSIYYILNTIVIYDLFL